MKDSHGWRRLNTASKSFKNYARLFELIDSVRDDRESGEIDIVDIEKANELAAYLRQLSAFLSEHLREEINETGD